MSALSQTINRELKRVQFEPYDARLGCLAFPYNDVWVAVEPNGRLLTCTDANEYAAREAAMYRNLTATDEERQAWRV